MAVFLYGDDFPGVMSYDYEAPYREHSKNHEFVVQHCPKCGNWQHTPRPFCNNCHAPWAQMEFAKTEGKGKIKAYVHQFRALLAPWQSRVPFTAVIVEISVANKLTGPILMLGNLINNKVDPENPAEPRLFGKEVRAVFEDGGGTAMVNWELV